MDAKKCQHRVVVKYHFNPIVEPRGRWTNSLLHEFTRNGEAIVETEGGTICLLPLGGGSGENYYEIRMGHREPEPDINEYMNSIT